MPDDHLQGVQVLGLPPPVFLPDVREEYGVQEDPAAVHVLGNVTFVHLLDGMHTESLPFLLWRLRTDRRSRSETLPCDPHILIEWSPVELRLQQMHNRR